MERREALLALAASHDAVVIEDDPYESLRYRGDDVPSVAALGGAEVVSIGTFSKTFLPGLRVGWVIARPEVIGRMSRAKQTMDSSTGTLAQRIVLEFHRRGGADAHVGRLRELYREKQDRARSALARELAGTGIAWNDPDGGFYFWLRLPKAISARALLEVALDEGVAFVPGDAFAIDADHRCVRPEPGDTDAYNGAGRDRDLVRGAAAGSSRCCDVDALIDRPRRGIENDRQRLDRKCPVPGRTKRER